MIGVRLKDITIPKELKREPKEVKSYVNHYIYDNIDTPLRSALHRVATSYIYQKVNKDTGKLGRSMKPTKRMINQYAMNFGFDFDEKIAPHAPTQVGRGWQVITPKVAQALTVPIKGGPADVKGRRVKARSFPDLKLDKKRGVLYEGRDVRHIIYDVYKLKRSVRIMRRVDPAGLASTLATEMRKPIDDLASKAIRDFYK